MSLLETLIVLLLIMWALGFGFGVSQFIHVILLVVLALIVVRIIQGRPVA